MARQSIPDILDLKITLLDTEPAVWRRILVPDVIDLGGLHSIIQLVMGWQSSHLYGFNIGDNFYTEPDEDGFEIERAKDVDISLKKAIGKNMAFTYTYDFGDNWEHQIEVLGKSKPKDTHFYPLCVGGENACPPEDCGGTPGYEDFLKSVMDPKDEGHEESLEWIGGYFDPKGFDANLVNKMFRMPFEEGLYEED